jgi:hypothetical protein
MTTANLHGRVLPFLLKREAHFLVRNFTLLEIGSKLCRLFFYNVAHIVNKAGFYEYTDSITTLLLCFYSENTPFVRFLPYSRTNLLTI